MGVTAVPLKGSAEMCLNTTDQERPRLLLLLALIGS